MTVASLEPFTILTYLYVPDLLADDPTNTEPWTASPSKLFVGDVHDKFVTSVADAATDVQATAQPQAGSSELVVSVPIEDTIIDLSLGDDSILEQLARLYAIAGWKGVASATIAVDQKMALLFPDRVALPEGEDSPSGGVPASSSIRPMSPQVGEAAQNPADISGFPAGSDVSGGLASFQPVDDNAQYTAWTEARTNFANAKEALAAGVVTELTAAEKLITDWAVAALFKAQSGAIVQSQKYRIGQNDKGQAVFGDPAAGDSLAVVMRELLAARSTLRTYDLDYNRAIAEQAAAEKGKPEQSPYAGSPTDLSHAATERATLQASLDALLDQHREEHPLCGTLLLTLDADQPKSDEEFKLVLAKNLDSILQAIIETTDSFNPPPPHFAAVTGDKAAWNAILRDGPEAWLLAMPDPVEFDPLLFQPAVASALYEPRQDFFGYVVLLRYLQAFSERDKQREATARGLAFLEAAILCGSVLVQFGFPEAAGAQLVLRLINGALTINAAIQTVSAMARLKAVFTAQAQAAITELGENGTLAQWDQLGAALANRPYAGDYARVLLSSGIPQGAAISLTKAAPMEQFLLLQLVVWAFGGDSADG